MAGSFDPHHHLKRADCLAQLGYFIRHLQDSTGHECLILWAHPAYQCAFNEPASI